MAAFSFERVADILYGAILAETVAPRSLAIPRFVIYLRRRFCVTSTCRSADSERPTSRSREPVPAAWLGPRLKGLAVDARLEFVPRHRPLTSALGKKIRAFLAAWACYIRAMKLKAIIHEAEDGGYWAEVPALPGCVTQGETRKEIEDNLREAIEAWLTAGECGFEAGTEHQIMEVAV